MTVQIQKFKMFLAGDWHDSSSGAVSMIIDPSTNQTVAQVPKGSRADARAADSIWRCWSRSRTHSLLADVANPFPPAESTPVTVRWTGAALYA